MTREAYKRLSLKEFDQTATKFDDNAPSVYNMCRKDYPDVLATSSTSVPCCELLILYNGQLQTYSFAIT